MTEARKDVLLAAILEVKGEVGQLRGEMQQVLGMEARVRALEEAGAGGRGEKRIKGSIWQACWEIGKLAAAAAFGGYVSQRLKG
jgi:hypothetical protein